MEIAYNSDVYFKYALSQDDNESELLRKTIINHFNIDYDEVTVINPDILPDNYDDKNIILDLLLKTKTGEVINMEMQVSALNRYQYHRFQYYGAKCISDQLNRGDSYLNLKKVYQIIFITDTCDEKLYHIYTSKDITYEEEPYNLLTRIYVFLPNISKHIRSKDASTISLFEIILNMFHLNSIDDIISLEGADPNMKDNPVYKAMTNKMNELNEDEALKRYALSRQLGQIMANTLKKDYDEKIEKLTKDEARVKEELARVEEYKAKVKEDKARVEEYKARVEEDKAKVEEDKAKVEEDKAKVEEDKAKVEEDKARVEEDKAKVEEDKARIEEDKAKVEEDKARIKKEKEQIILLCMKTLNCSKEEAIIFLQSSTSK